MRIWERHGQFQGFQGVGRCGLCGETSAPRGRSVHIAQFQTEIMNPVPPRQDDPAPSLPTGPAQPHGPARADEKADATANTQASTTAGLPAEPPPLERCVPVDTSVEGARARFIFPSLREDGQVAMDLVDLVIQENLRLQIGTCSSRRLCMVGITTTQAVHAQAIVTQRNRSTTVREQVGESSTRVLAQPSRGCVREFRSKR